LKLSDRINLQKLIPEIRRARGYRLYSYDGRRYIDCYQNGGRAVLGHRAGKLTKTLKNVISKGLILDLPSVHARRLKKAVRGILPDFERVLIFGNRERAIEALSLDDSEIEDPAIERRKEVKAGSRGDAALWRPFLRGIDWSGFKILLPILPFSMADSPCVVCIRNGIDLKLSEDGLPEDDVVSPVMLAGATRSIYDMPKYQIPPWAEKFFGNTSGSKNENSAAGWKRNGPYLTCLCEREAYEGIFRAFLENGVLISPYYPGPTILPAEVSDGELKKIVRLFYRFPGK